MVVLSKYHDYFVECGRGNCISFDFIFFKFGQLGEDEDKPPLDDVWDGINFMVDNETGEFFYAICIVCPLP